MQWTRSSSHQRDGSRVLEDGLGNAMRCVRAGEGSTRRSCQAQAADANAMVVSLPADCSAVETKTLTCPPTLCPRPGSTFVYASVGIVAWSSRHQSSDTCTYPYGAHRAILPTRILPNAAARSAVAPPPPPPRQPRLAQPPPLHFQWQACGRCRRLPRSLLPARIHMHVYTVTYKWIFAYPLLANMVCDSKEVVLLESKEVVLLEKLN